MYEFFVGNEFPSGRSTETEVEQLQRQLNDRQETQRHEIEEILCEEQNARNENVRLQRKLQVEVSSDRPMRWLLLLFSLGENERNVVGCRSIVVKNSVAS